MTRHLLVIDMQHVFADPASAWVAPRFAEILDAVDRLAAAYEPHVTFTRFVAPAEPHGAWRDYYRAWPFALRPPGDPLYALVDRFAGRPTHDATTFGKWTPELAGMVGEDVVVAGVATDCCVLSTVLAAADSGATVHVAADACTGSTDDNHAKALDLMRLYEPLVTVTTTESLAQAPHAGRA